jgi:hypothetical protein
MTCSKDNQRFVDTALWVHERFRYAVIYDTNSLQNALYPKAEQAGLRNEDVRACIWWMIDFNALTLGKNWDLTRGPNYDTVVDKIEKFKENFC